MAEYSRMAKGYYTVSGGTLGSSAPNAKVINLPFKPDYVELINLTQAVTPAQHGIPFAFWDASATPITVSSVNYDTIVEVFNSTPVLLTDSVKVGGGISAFSAGQMLQYGPLVLLGTTGGAGIAKTSATVLTVTTAAAHGLAAGNWIVFQNLYETSTTGMQQIAGIPFEVVSVTNSTVFTISWVGNSSNLTTIDTSATGACGFKQILYPAIYCPGVAVPWAITVSAGTGTVSTTAPHNFQVGQQIAFRIPAAWGAKELNEGNGPIPGQAQTFYVATVARNSFTFANAPSSITAFNVNQTFASFPGLKFPEVVAVGDVNSGGFAYSGSQLYPSPQLYSNSQTLSSTVNGPAISGAYVNNTSSGFIVGNSASRTDTSSWVGGSNGDVIEWRAYLHDISLPN